MKATQGTLALDPHNGSLSITAFGGSWVCGHRVWVLGDGLLLLPIPADSVIVVDRLSASPVDLEGLDRQRLAAALQTLVQSADLAGARLTLATLHECFRAARSIVFVVATRPPILATPGAAVGGGVAFDATVV